MNQDYRLLKADEIELLEKQTLRMIVQALQEYSGEARSIFENTAAPSDNEVIVLAEDLVQYALEVAECYPINKRFAGFIDYKRVRWMPTPYGLFPQVLLVDAKASTENNRETLQQSQLPMDAEFVSNGQPRRLPAGIPPHLEIESATGGRLYAITTSAFIHYYYEKLGPGGPPYRRLRSIFALMIPHQLLKGRYNPAPGRTFFGQGKHSPARGEVPRIRVYFARLRSMCPWRLQELKFSENHEFSMPSWRDLDTASEHEIVTQFQFLSR
jgi:hypothetical protein